MFLSTDAYKLRLSGPSQPSSNFEVNQRSPFIMDAGLPSSVAWDFSSLSRRDEDEAGLSTSPHSAFSDWDSDDDSITDCSDYDDEDEDAAAQCITIDPGHPFYAPVSRPPAHPLKLSFDLEPAERQGMSFACGALGLDSDTYMEAMKFHDEIAGRSMSSFDEDALDRLEIELLPPPPVLSFTDDSGKRPLGVLPLTLQDPRYDVPIDLSCEDGEDSEDYAGPVCLPCTLGRNGGDIY